MPMVMGLVNVPTGIDGVGGSAGQVWPADGSNGAAWQAAAGGGATDVTYAELVAAIGVSGLTPGAFYRITDFATKHYIVDGDGTVYTTGDGIITGATEPLIVQALAVDELGSLAFSADYPGDVLHYDWNPANWLADICLAYDPGTGVEIITGFKGVITFRHDTILNNRAYYDFRNCKTRRWTTDVGAWDDVVEYIAGDFCEYSSGVYRSLQTGTNQQPDIETAYWALVLDLSNSVYWNASPVTWLNIPSGALYADLLLFQDATCTNNLLGKFTRLVDGNTFGAGCTYNTFGAECGNNTLGAVCGYNTFGAGCFGNLFGAGCSYNTFGVGCSGNLFGADCGNNAFGGGCSDNIFYVECSDNAFGGGCGSNTFGAGCVKNIFGAVCSYNVFGVECYGNAFGSGCNSNTFGEGARGNRADSGAIDNVDFTAATHVYGAYSCELMLDAGIVARLRYIDASGAQQIVAATA